MDTPPTGQNINESGMIPLAVLCDPLSAMIRNDRPELGMYDSIPFADLSAYYLKYQQLHQSNPLLSYINEDIDEIVDDSQEANTTFANRIADKVADFGGSWTFILTFCGLIFVWILANVYFLYDKGFDPYPFILLNLILSCVAALQAPVIMMSQNRQEDKDRNRAKKDFLINLKAEMEIRALHEKLDLLLEQHNLNHNNDE